MAVSLKPVYDSALAAELASFLDARRLVAHHVPSLNVTFEPCFEASSIRGLLADLHAAQTAIPDLVNAEAEELGAVQGVARNISRALVLAAPDFLRAAAAERKAEAARQADKEQRQAAAEERARFLKTIKIKALCEVQLAVCILGGCRNGASCNAAMGRHCCGRSACSAPRIAMALCRCKTHPFSCLVCCCQKNRQLAPPQPSPRSAATPPNPCRRRDVPGWLGRRRLVGLYKGEERLGGHHNCVAERCH